MRPRAFLFFFGGLWSLITCTAVVLFIVGSVRQRRALHFPTTPGLVDSAEIIEVHHKGISYEAHIAYHYEVNNHRHKGNQLRYMNNGAGSWSWAQSIKEQFAVGTRPAVYYNPANPDDAILMPGLRGSDLLGALVLTPFLLIMLVLWTSMFKPPRKSKIVRGPHDHLLPSNITLKPNAKRSMMSP